MWQLSVLEKRNRAICTKAESLARENLSLRTGQIFPEAVVVELDEHIAVVEEVC